MADSIRGTLLDNFGRPIASAAVTVYKAGTVNLASLYSDSALTASVGNPLTTEADGSYLAFAPNGRYDIIPAKTGYTFDTTDSVGEVTFDPAITRTVSATDSMVDKDYVVLLDAGVAPLTFNLLALSNIIEGQPYVLIKKDATANAVTIDPSGAETINGAATLVLSAKQGVVIRKSGTEWRTDTPPAQLTSGAGLIPLGRSSDGKLDPSWVVGTGAGVPLTTKGDLLTYDATVNRLPVGANQTLLMADSAQSLGIKWISGGIFIGSKILTKLPQTFTVTIASPAVFTATTHGFVAGDAVHFSTTGALPTGLTVGTVYYVISAGLTANDFEVSTTPGGAAVNTSGSQSGTHTVNPAYIPTTGTKHIILEVVGGGGAGGGGKVTGAAQVGLASGGGGGGYARKVFLNVGAGPFVCVIGAGGTGVSGGNGNNGSSTTFIGPGPLTIIGTGGGGGISAAAGAAPLAQTSLGSGAGGTNGDINITAEDGMTSWATVNTLVVAGDGGCGVLGHGGRGGGVMTGAGTGNAGRNYGGGGSGAANKENNAASTGGAGAQGIIIIWEFA